MTRDTDSGMVDNKDTKILGGKQTPIKKTKIVGGGKPTSDKVEIVEQRP
jgi:hypothetical protein